MKKIDLYEKTINNLKLIALLVIFILFLQIPAESVQAQVLNSLIEEEKK